jgi:hypothetical protein
MARATQEAPMFSGKRNLDELIASLAPTLHDGEFAFVTFPEATYGAHADLSPVAAFAEAEGLTLVVPRQRAERAGLSFDGVFRMITLNVHSSLAAVGLTAAVAGRLAKRGISANVVAAFYHDHVFVPAPRAEEALRALEERGLGAEPIS